MKKKLLVLVLSLMCVLTCAFGLAACDYDSGETQHTHSYQWVDNGDGTHEQHCSVSGCDNPNINAGEHDFSNGDCVCGKEPGPAELFIYRLNTDNESYIVAGLKKCETLEIVIPDNYDNKPVTVIDYDAFKNNTYIKSVTIPKTVKYIGVDSFTGCKNLTNIYYAGDFDDWCTIYGHNNLDKNKVYVNNEKLLDMTSITVPDGVTRIGDSAFKGCISLTSIVLPDSVTHIDYSAFEGCTSLIDINLPDGVNVIGRYAFRDCTSLTSITIPDSITSIGFNAFIRCTGLEDVIIGDGISVIDDYAFGGCVNLKRITIGAGIKRFEDNVFENCDNIESIYYNGNLAGWCGINGLSALDKSKVYINNEKLYDMTQITIPESVTSIAGYAFYGCSSLRNLTIHDNVTSIGNSAFTYCPIETAIIPVYAIDHIGVSKLKSLTITSGNEIKSYSNFNNCKNLADLTISDNITRINYDFKLCEKLENIYYTGDIEKWCAIEGLICLDNSKVFINNEKLLDMTSITVPDGVTRIGDFAFSGCISLIDINLPDGVNVIGRYAFRDCTSLTSITIPDSITSIGFNAFSGCSIETATIPAVACSAINNSVLKTVIITSGENIANRAFYDCSSLTSITISDSVTSIGYNAFYGCNRLENIYYTGDIAGWCGINGLSALDKSKVYINNEKLYDMTQITIPESVTSIAGYAFYGCSSLRNLTIHDNVTSIGDHAFTDCPITTASIPAIACIFVNNKALNTVVITSGENIADRAFYNCIKLKSVTLPDSIKSIGEGAFGDCISLKSITLPDGVIFIGESVFVNCENLTSITLPGSITSIGEYIFNGCISLKEIYFGGTMEQWKALDINNRYVKFHTIHCTDGNIAKS